MLRSRNLMAYGALSVCHTAGMIDLAALPLWVGALMKHYQLPAPQAGLIVTTFLLSVVAASLIFAPRFNRLPHRAFAFSGFALSTAAFCAASLAPVAPASFALFVVTHAAAGFGAGMALSVTHGAIGRTDNPHRLFGIVNVAMGMLAIVMFALVPGLIERTSGPGLFRAFAATMGVAAIVSLLFFPRTAASTEGGVHTAARRLPKGAWLIIGAVVCMTLNQSTVFSFVERIGLEYGFGRDPVQLILLIMGFVNLTPGLLAALLQKRLPPLAVGIAGPILQAIFALSLTNASQLPLYAAPAIFYVGLVVFTHIFLFGLLARIDITGRAVAATPAMMMFGSAMGPALGGGIVATFGYHALGWSVAVFAAVAVSLVMLLRRELARGPEAATLAVA